MTTTEVQIHNRDDLRPGDVLRVWPQDNPERWAEGPIRERSDGALVVATLCIRRWVGTWVSTRFDLTAHPARREVPNLPTEAGSVILVTAICGERLDEPMPAMCGDSGRWYVIGCGWHDPEYITGWIPATVTEAGPEVTR